MNYRAFVFSHYGPEFTGRYGDLEGVQSRKAIFEEWEIDKNGKIERVINRVAQIYVPVNDRNFHFIKGDYYRLMKVSVKYSEDTVGNKNFSRNDIAQTTLEDEIKSAKSYYGSGSIKRIMEITESVDEDNRNRLDERLGRNPTAPIEPNTNNNDPKLNKYEKDEDELPF